MEKVWAQQFQGARLSADHLMAHLRANGRLVNKARSFHLSFMRCAKLAPNDIEIVVRELKRVLARGGIALFQIACHDADVWQQQTNRLNAAMTALGFKVRPDVLFASSAVNYSFVPLNVFEIL